MDKQAVFSEIQERNDIKVIRSRPDKLGGLVDHLKSLKEKKFTGYVKLNYTQGALGRIEQFEEILREK